MKNKKTDPHTHWLHLPKFASHSGQKPSKAARLNFVIISLILVFCFIELLISAVTTGRMAPGVSIAGKDVSFLSRKQTFDYLSKQNLERTFTIRVGDKVFTSSSDNLGAHYDIATTVDTAYQIGHNQPLGILDTTSIGNGGEIGYAYNVDLVKLKTFTDSIIRSVGYGAQNASLQVVDGRVEIIPDKDGLRVDQKYLNKILAISLQDAKDQNIVLQPQTVKADILASDTTDAKVQAEEILSKTINLNFEGKKYSPDRSAMGHMIVFREVVGNNSKPQLQANISPEQVAGYVQGVANQINITPINKKINIRNGVSSVEREGKDGRAINQQAVVDEIVNTLQNKQSVSININSSPVAFQTETNRTTGLDIGTYIEVSLSQQRLWAYQDNQVIFATPITSGASGYGFGTQTGLFAIYSKQRSRYLNGSQYGWSYNVFVDYWMPFNGGYGLHDADWRSSFGGQDYINGGSHGCVNMSKSSAAFLYNWSSVGTPVWVHG